MLQIFRSYGADKTDDDLIARPPKRERFKKSDIKININPPQHQPLQKNRVALLPILMRDQLRV